MIETTGEGKSAVATPDGKKPKEEEDLVCKWLTNRGVEAQSFVWLGLRDGRVVSVGHFDEPRGSRHGHVEFTQSGEDFLLLVDNRYLWQKTQLVCESSRGYWQGVTLLLLHSIHSAPCISPDGKFKGNNNKINKRSSRTAQHFQERIQSTIFCDPLPAYRYGVL